MLIRTRGHQTPRSSFSTLVQSQLPKQKPRSGAILDCQSSLASPDTLPSMSQEPIHQKSREHLQCSPQSPPATHLPGWRGCGSPSPPPAQCKPHLAPLAGAGPPNSAQTPPRAALPAARAPSNPPQGCRNWVRVACLHWGSHSAGSPHPLHHARVAATHPVSPPGADATLCDPPVPLSACSGRGAELSPAHPIPQGA